MTPDGMHPLMWETYMQLRFGVDHQTEVCVEIHGGDLCIELCRFMAWSFEKVERWVKIPLSAYRYGYAEYAIKEILLQWEEELKPYFAEAQARRSEIMMVIAPRMLLPQPHAHFKITGIS